MTKQRVAVDFDGVLHQYNGWQGDGTFADPVPGAKQFLEKISRHYDVVVCTARDRLDFVCGWLSKHSMLGLVELVTNQKPIAVAYIDDRGVRFNGDFDAMYEAIKQKPWWQM